MSVAFVNAGSEGFAGSGTTVTPGSPASPTNGHVWVCWCFHSQDLTPTMHADWTLGGSYNPGSQATRLTFWWFRYAGVAPTDNVITTSSSTANRTAGIAAFSGCLASGTPWVDSDWSSAQWGTAYGAWCEAMKTTKMGSMILRAIGCNDDVDVSFKPGFQLSAEYSTAFEDSAGGTQNVFKDATGSPDSALGLFYQLQELPAFKGVANVLLSAAATWITKSITLLPEPTHKIAGVSRDNAGAVLGSMDMYLFHYDSHVFTFIEKIVSDSSTGAFEFQFCPAASGTYAVMGRKTGSPNKFDTTDFNLSPVTI